MTERAAKADAKKGNKTKRKDMKTKKLFMLLVALIGVTGAWAQTEDRSYTIDYSSIVLNMPNNVNTNVFWPYLEDNGDSYVNVHMNKSENTYILKTGIDDWHTKLVHLNHAYIYITCKDPAVTLISASTSEYQYNKLYYPTDDSNTIILEDVSNISCNYSGIGYAPSENRLK